MSEIQPFEHDNPQAHKFGIHFDYPPKTMPVVPGVPAIGKGHHPTPWDHVHSLDLAEIDGAVTDSNFISTTGANAEDVVDGILAIDSTNEDLYMRVNGAWVKVGGLPPYVSLYDEATGQSIPNNTATVFNTFSAEFSGNGVDAFFEWTTTPGVFTCLKECRILATFSSTWPVDPVPVGSGYLTTWMDGPSWPNYGCGDTITYISSVSPNGWDRFHSSGSFILHMFESDYLNLRAIQNTGGALTMNEVWFGLIVLEEIITVNN